MRAPSATLLAALLATLAPACDQPVDAAPLGNYRAWKERDVQGFAPGHGDTYRKIYANPIAAADVPWFGGYPDDSILVKEVYDLDGDQPGALREIAIMRRIGQPIETVRLEDERRWIFSQADSFGGEESKEDYCWSACHVAAPYNGVWYDYRR